MSCLRPLVVSKLRKNTQTAGIDIRRGLFRENQAYHSAQIYIRSNHLRQQKVVSNQPTYMVVYAGWVEKPFFLNMWMDCNQPIVSGSYLRRL